MSYTHQWCRPQIMESDSFALFSNDVRDIIKYAGPRFIFFGGIKIGGASGWGWPILTDSSVCFNGRPSMETFWIEQDHLKKYRNANPGDEGLFEDYVSTGKKPYDAVVVASLLALRFHYPKVKIYSDGVLTDWQLGHQLFQEATGKKISLPSSDKNTRVSFL